MRDDWRVAAEKLIVAADFKPDGDVLLSARKEWVRQQVLQLAQSLKGTGVYLKVNSALRACGYELIEQIRSFELKVFADLKLYDIGETLSTDGALLRQYEPEIVTVACVAGVKPLIALRNELPNTEILGITVLTSLDDADAQAMFSCSMKDAVCRFGGIAVQAGLGGLISAPAEAEMLRSDFGALVTLNTPGIRPAWASVKGDDQNKSRTMTPARAIKAGATRIVVGRPITQHMQPFNAVMHTIEEIAGAMAPVEL